MQTELLENITVYLGKDKKNFGETSFINSNSSSKRAHSNNSKFDWVTKSSLNSFVKKKRDLKIRLLA